MNQKLDSALQRLTKWRLVFAGWQLGTRRQDDPECQAVRDHREVTILMRAEINALTAILKEHVESLYDHGDVEQFDRRFEEALLREAELLNKDYEQKFPGATTSEVGVHFDMKRAKEWMEKWRP